MEDNQPPIEVTLNVTESDDINKIFIGYKTADETEYILASVEPPASATLRGIPPSPEEES